MRRKGCSEGLTVPGKAVNSVQADKWLVERYQRGPTAMGMVGLSLAG